MAELKRYDDGAVRTLVLNRPEVRNALDLALVKALQAALAEARDDGAVRCLMIAGAGKGFCAGADVKQWSASSARGESTGWVEEMHALIAALFAFPRPTVAVVRGAAAGAGVDLALACDFRFAADDARFVCAYTRMGYPPDAGGTWLLPRLVGPEAAKRFVFTGATWDAAEALSRGLVGEVHPADRVAEVASAFAAQLAMGPTVAQLHAKRLIDGAPARSLEAQLAAELAAGNACRGTADAKEAMRAAVEKRAPAFVGH